MFRMASWNDIKDIQTDKIVLKPAGKAPGAGTNAYTSWINYGNGPLRFKLPPGKVGFPPEPYAAGQIGSQTFNYQLHAETMYQNADGTTSLVGQAQRDLVRAINSIEDTMISMIVKDPQAYHPKFSKTADESYIRALWSSTVKQSADPKWPSTIRVKLMSHRDNSSKFQGRSLGKTTEELVVEDRYQHCLPVDTTNVHRILQRNTNILPVIQAVNLRFQPNKITVGWRLVYAVIEQGKPQTVTATDFPVIEKTDFMDAGWGADSDQDDDHHEVDENLSMALV